MILRPYRRIRRLVAERDSARIDLGVARGNLADLEPVLVKVIEERDAALAEVDVLAAKLTATEPTPRPGPAVTPARPVHPSCANAAGRVCAICRPRLGYHHPTSGHPTPGGSQ